MKSASARVCLAHSRAPEIQRDAVEKILVPGCVVQFQLEFYTQPVLDLARLLACRGLIRFLWALTWRTFQLIPYSLWQLIAHQLIGSLNQTLQFCVLQHPELLERDPVITGHVGRRNDALALRQFSEGLRRTLQ